MRGGKTGVGYTCTDGCIASLIEGKLKEALGEADAMDPPAAWFTMQRTRRKCFHNALQVKVRNVMRD